VSEIIKKANRCVAMIKRKIAVNTTREVKLLLYKGLIRPNLEYCSVVWSQPNNRKLVKKLEMVQKRFTKFILNDYVSEFKDRLIRCNILPLTYRREFLDCVFLYNLLHNLVIMDTENLLLLNNTITNTRLKDDETRLKGILATTELYRNYFPNRIVKIWNSVPREIREADLTDSGSNLIFKTLLKKHYYEVLSKDFNSDNLCTWITNCNCPSCRWFK
jgi:hypothetical protein